ncbi:MAG TPA: GTPase Era [Chitinophagaceae bacterium]|nr:GTPase Era [Chitinophagaceae bacterium]
MKAGFVNIFGKPNAGKSTLLNVLLGEKLAITSSKVQTTRHRIKGILTTEEYQLILSDTPGIIEPKYKLHERMMTAVKEALEDADVAVLLHDLTDKDTTESNDIFTALALRVPVLVVCNKMDKVGKERTEAALSFFKQQPYCTDAIAIAAIKNQQTDQLLARLTALLPEGEPFFAADDITDLPVRFFVGEMIREKIYELYEEEIPYHTTVLVQEFKEKTTLVKIQADIIVQRDTQKGIILGEKGQGIKVLGMKARADIEQFLGRKVFLELFVKVKPKWRDNDTHLKEYGYH